MASYKLHSLKKNVADRAAYIEIMLINERLLQKPAMMQILNKSVQLPRQLIKPTLRK